MNLSQNYIFPTLWKKKNRRIGFVGGVSYIAQQRADLLKPGGSSVQVLAVDWIVIKTRHFLEKVIG